MENVEKFYGIKIKDKACYLMVDDKGQFTWTKNKNDILSFDMEHEANNFAQKYFTKFKNWEVTAINIKF